jgi:hypothetical protein
MARVRLQQSLDRVIRSAAIALTLVFISGCTTGVHGTGPASPGTGSSPASTPDPAPSTSAPDDESSSVLPNPGAVEAGEYALAALEPSPVIQLADGWWAGWDYGDRLEMPDGAVALEHRLSRGFVRLAFWDTTDIEIGGEARIDVRAFVRELPTVATLAEQPLVIGDVEATRFDFGWTGGFQRAIAIPRTAFEFANDEPQHWVVLDTTGDKLVINWTVENSAGPELEAEAAALVDSVLASIRL